MWCARTLHEKTVCFAIFGLNIAFKPVVEAKQLWSGSDYEMKTLLLVEDNQDNADLIRDLLEDDYRIVLFADGASALAALVSGQGALPDLLLLDISLPGMDGTTLLREIRQHERLRSIPAVALTAHAMKLDKENLIAAGFNGYVSKPITDERLLFEAIEAHTSVQPVQPCLTPQFGSLPAEGRGTWAA